MSSVTAVDAGTVAGRLTIVVPTLDSARTLAACLASLRAQTHPDVELVVVDNGSTDDTVAVARRFADRVERWGPERSAQRNRGMALATGEFVAFVDSDMVLEPGIAAEAVAAFARDPGLGALVVPERATGQGPWAAARVLEKDLYVGDPDVEAARVFRATALTVVGGYDEHLTAFEDWDLADRVAAAGFGTGRVRATIWHDEGRVRLGRAFAKKRYYGRVGLAYVARPSESGRRRLVRTGFLRRPGTLARRPFAAARLIVLKAVEAAGLAVGLWDARRAR